MYDQDGWPDLLVANDTQPNKLYRNQRNGTFKDVAVEAGLAFSSEGKARAGMGVDAADFDNSGHAGVAITNFDNEMIGLYQFDGNSFEDVAAQTGVGLPPKTAWVSAAFSSTPISMAGSISPWPTAISTKPSQHSRQCRLRAAAALFLNNGKGSFRDVAAEIGGGFDQPKVGRGLAYAISIAMAISIFCSPPTTAPRISTVTINLQETAAFAFAWSEPNPTATPSAPPSTSSCGGHDSISHGKKRLQLSFAIRTSLSLSDLGNAIASRASSSHWPSGRTEDYKNLAPGRCYECTEGKGDRSAGWLLIF